MREYRLGGGVAGGPLGGGDVKSGPRLNGTPVPLATDSGPGRPVQMLPLNGSFVSLSHHVSSRTRASRADAPS